MLNNLSLVFVIILTFGHLSQAQVPLPRKCPEVKVMSQFDLDAYMGIWYEHTKYPFIFEIGKRCMYAEYKNLGNSTISVMNAAINRFTGTPSDIKGYAKVLGPARLAVFFNKNQSPDRENYLVLDTDYTSYAVVYSCTDFGGVFHTEIVWILTRERKPSAETIAKAKKIMDDNKLSQSFLIDSVQDDCPNVGESSSSSSSDGNDIPLGLDASGSKNSIRYLA